MKICTKCSILKTKSDFPKRKDKKDGLHSHCKSCRAEYDKQRYDPVERKQNYLKDHEQSKQERRDYYLNHRQDYLYRKALRRATKLQATPTWFEEDLVSVVYKKAKQYNCNVDHIVPLQNPLVCGLHCWSNLQLLPEELNKSKGNRHWPDMP